MAYQYNQFPDIINYRDIHNNPTIVSTNAEYAIQFYATRESLLDIEEYKRFLDNAIASFRHCIRYKHYKGYLMDLGMDHCQFHGNINSEMATIEMNHTIITIFDVAVIITEHILNTVGMITTFDLVARLKEEHTNNRIPLTMMALTPHQLYHSDPDFFIHPSMIVGNWYEFLERYKYGITQDIAYKILYYVRRAIEEDGSDDNGLLELSANIKDWSNLNE